MKIWRNSSTIVAVWKSDEKQTHTEKTKKKNQKSEKKRKIAAHAIHYSYFGRWFHGRRKTVSANSQMPCTIGHKSILIMLVRGVCEISSEMPKDTPLSIFFRVYVSIQWWPLKIANSAIGVISVEGMRGINKMLANCEEFRKHRMFCVRKICTCQKKNDGNRARIY